MGLNEELPGLCNTRVVLRQEEFSAHILRKMYPVALQSEVCCLGVDLSRGIVKRLPPFLPRVWPHFPFPWKLSD